MIYLPTILQVTLIPVQYIGYKLKTEKRQHINQKTTLAALKLTKSCRLATPVNLALDFLSIRIYPCLFWYPITFLDAREVVGMFRSTSYNKIYRLGSSHILVTLFLVFRHLGCVIFCTMFYVCKARWAKWSCQNIT